MPTGERPRRDPGRRARARSTGALVPFENAIEGSVRPTLDTLAFEATGVTIAGEHDHPIRHALIARTELAARGDPRPW